jgi:flagellar biosynthesis anti-sigma factor FlgM
MKIEDNFSPSNDLRSQSVGRTPETRVEGRPSERKGENAGDSVSLSALSAELSRAIAKEPPQLQAKIERLQEAIANGTYAVPSKEVSAKIVASALSEQ